MDLLLNLVPFFFVLFYIIPHNAALKLVAILVHTIYFAAISREQSMTFLNNVSAY